MRNVERVIMLVLVGGLLALSFVLGVWWERNRDHLPIEVRFVYPQ